jgi:hypothetical protein
MYTQQEKLIAAALVAVVLIIIISVIYRRDHRPKSSFASCAGCGGDNTRRPPAVRRGEWVGGRGPYHQQLYDSPRYYPYYEGKDYMASWDKAGRCSAYCRASDDGGCAVVCR